MTAQRSEEWFARRLGKATASNFSKILAKGDGKTRERYLLQVVAQRLTGKAEDGYTNADMERGVEQEPLGRMAYEARTGNVVQEVGFIDHPALAAGCSPDGLIGDDGGFELKSVIPTVQIQTIKRGAIPPEHIAQVQGCMWVTGRQWWDFASYSPDFLDEKLKLVVYRVPRNDDYILLLEQEVTGFLRDVDKMVKELS